MEYEILTERLILRPITMEDAQDFYELDSNPKVHQYIGNQPVSSIAQSIEMIQSILKQYDEFGIGRFAIMTKDTKEFVGWSGLKFEQEVREDVNYYDLGYRLKEEFWGCGIATEAAIASLNFGFNELKLDEICAAADANNIGSNRILKKIGMTLSDTFIYDSALCNWYIKPNPNI